MLMQRVVSFLISLLFLAVADLSAQQQQVPKLVVCITVDQLRGDYIEYFSHTFGEHGFKRLLNEGKVYQNVRFDFANIDQATAFATLFTGTNPSFHGIYGSRKYDFDKGREVSVLNDPEYLGNYTPENYSPKALISSTVGDELKIASKGRSEVFAVAPDAESAILSAGRTANAAFWMDNYNGKWATTTFYKGIPWYIDRYNNAPDALTARLSSMIWTPALSLENYNAFPYVQDGAPFRHTFDEKKSDNYLNLKTSPFINREVTRLALQFLEYAAFGTRSCPDMLAVTYYAGNYRLLLNKEYNREIQDLYHRLDKDLEELLNAIDKKVGIANTLIVFTGSGYYRSEEDYPESLPPGNGDFYPKRCIALLNMYLMAAYGQDRNWVTGYYNSQIFLNRKAIEDAKLNLAEIQTKAAEFVQEFTGVQHVTTNHALLTGRYPSEASPLYHGTHHLGRGDLIIELQPGRRINLENSGSKTQLTRNNAVPTPLVFMGNGFKAQRIPREVNAVEIAPTLTHILRIRPPNAARSLPLRELRGEN